MSMRRRLLLGALLLPALAGALPAQTEIEFTGPELIPGPWKFDNFPYFTVTPNDGFMLIGRAQYGRAADFLDRVSMAQRIAFEGGISPSGSRFASLRYDAPRLLAGWRIASELRLERANRLGYYGLGNYPDEADAAAELRYRVRRNRALARVEVTRTITGPLQVAVAGGTGSADFHRLPGATRFAEDVGATLEERDTWGRVALVLDLRDNEYLPTRGALVEGGVFTGSGGQGYSGWYASASGFATPAFGTVLAARLAARSMDREAPLTARYEIQAWERELPVLGGPASHRAFPIGRYVGHSALFGSVELRQLIVDGGDFGGIYGLAFLDAGRVFEQEPVVDAPAPHEPFRLTTRGLKVGGGIGVGLRILRANLLSITAARGPEGTRVMVGSGWAF